MAGIYRSVYVRRVEMDGWMDVVHLYVKRECGGVVVCFWLLLSGHRITHYTTGQSVDGIGVRVVCRLRRDVVLTQLNPGRQAAKPPSL